MRPRAAARLSGTCACTTVVHAVLPEMRRRKDGLIVNITSIAGKRTISKLAGSAYCASKFGMNSLGAPAAPPRSFDAVLAKILVSGEALPDSAQLGFSFSSSSSPPAAKDPCLDELPFDREAFHKKNLETARG